MTQPTSSPSGSSSSSRVPATRNDSSLVSDKGTTTIADTVVSKIAGLAASQVSGVHALGSSAGRAFGSLRERIPGQRASVSQGVSVEVDDQTATVQVSVVAEYGVAIADVANAIRANVVRAVEQMTGLHVGSVDIEVTDIHLPGEDDDSDDEK